MKKQIENPVLKKNKVKLKIYETLLDISADGFVFIDDQERIIKINKAYCAFLDVKEEDVLGKKILDVIKNSKLPELLVTGEAEVNVLHRLAKGQTPGDEKCVAVSRSAVKEGDKIIGAVGQIYFRKETMELAEQLRSLDSELNYYKNELKRVTGNHYSFDNIIGQNKQFLAIKKIAEKAAKNDFSILLFGDTGTGKEVFANAIHYASRRKDKPLVSVNCSAIPSELLESELFGYEEGAFTGAKKGGKKGKFELADGGTLFLDEIGDMPMTMQAKLLRVLQEGEIEKIGGYKPVPVDVRIIAATNRDLESGGRKALRDDLYYRLSVIQLRIPSLKERPDDIRNIAEKFLAELNKAHSRSVIVSPDAYRFLERYSWPGNIRELRNAIQRSYCVVSGNIILPAHLPSYIVTNTKVPASAAQKKTLDKMIEEIEKEILQGALQQTNFNYKLTARELGIHRSTLYKKLEKLNITRNGCGHHSSSDALDNISDD
ncbi:MAG TPA: sigma 54-interacting transcriptional regulator [Smithellaceae bacterium]|nr:sigma 54-interacting transcriptional regulator [Smithellaceae bacterium]